MSKLKLNNVKERANRIHITSSGPRTGSTLLAEAMKVCFEIECYCDHEAPISKSNTSFGNCKTILTKHPSSTKNLDKVLSWDKNLFIICIIRDPRDMVSSYHGKINDKYYCELNFWFEFFLNLKKLDKHERFLLIKYEELTKNPDKIQSLILKRFSFLKEKYNFSNYHHHSKPNDDSLKALNQLRPIQSKGIGNWKNNLSRIKQQIQKYNGLEDTLIQFGYEQNNDWLNILEEINSEEFESYKSTEIRKNNNKSLILTYFNILLEKNGLNPDKILAPVKYIL
jgi:hypothetical protein